MKSCLDESVFVPPSQYLCFIGFAGMLIEIPTSFGLPSFATVSHSCPIVSLALEWDIGATTGMCGFLGLESIQDSQVILGMDDSFVVDTDPEKQISYTNASHFRSLSANWALGKQHRSWVLCGSSVPLTSEVLWNQLPVKDSLYRLQNSSKILVCRGVIRNSVCTVSTDMSSSCRPSCLMMRSDNPFDSPNHESPITDFPRTVEERAKAQRNHVVSLPESQWFQVVGKSVAGAQVSWFIQSLKEMVTWLRPPLAKPTLATIGVSVSWDSSWNKIEQQDEKKKNTKE